MTVTKQLLDLFRVDKQLRGLRSRLDAAERFLQQQQSQLGDLAGRHSSIETQIKQAKATAHANELEMKRLDEKIAHIREQMNSAKTAKEYNAFLTELGTFKDQRSEFESQALNAMTRVDALQKELDAAKAQAGERQKIVDSADADRRTKAEEIKDRLDELTNQRATLAAGIPKETLAVLDHLIKTKGDDAMAHVDILDRRNYEYSCAACYMTLPMETVNSVVAGKVTRCVSCGAILFTEDDELVKQPAKSASKSKPKAPKKAKTSDADAAAAESA